MAELKQGTWIVVADSEKALFMRNLTDHENPNLEVFRIDTQDNPADGDQGTDRPGRRSDSGMGQKSAMQETDWHALAKERFAADLAEKLYAHAHRGAFESLVLVAAPQVLGDLRDALHEEVTNRVIAEIPKTLTGHSVDKIETLIKRELDTA